VDFCCENILLIKRIYLTNLQSPNMRCLLSVVLFVVWYPPFCTLLYAQDSHFSQFFNTSLATNPALTGVFEGDARYAALYRQQWDHTFANYTTFYGGFDQKIRRANQKNNLLAWGATFQHDAAGDAKLSTTQLATNFSFTRRLDERFFITLAVQTSVAQYAFNIDALRFDNQINNKKLEREGDSKERFATNTRFVLDGATGINWHYVGADGRTQFDLGSAVFHLSAPKISFRSTKNSIETLPIRYNFYLNNTFSVGERTDWSLIGRYAAQGTFSEKVVGTAIRYHLKLGKNNPQSLHIGTLYNIQRAWIPYLELQTGTWLFSLSYDVPIGDLKGIARAASTPEIGMMYRIAKVQPVEIFKACPIY
jgi:type IX secretion system PorP/SprF family membrane protein